tara:strand:- start:4018 stop:4806 length:789 start_codon:yes stop_codon:yes gene_type:complete
VSRTILQNGILNIENLEVHYGPIIALRGVTISVKSGQSVALLGSNGAGKSTLLKAVSGILLPSKGSIRFEGKSILGKDPSIIVSMGLAHVPEGREIFPLLTVKQNLLLGAYSRVDKRQVKRDFDLVIHYFPALQDLLKMEAKVLSGGQQQMLALGRAIMSKPRLLLLDEPSLGLSPIIVKEIFSILKNLQKDLGLSILIVEQNAKLALNLSDYAYVLELGRVAMSDSTGKVMNSRDIQEFYLGMHQDSQIGKKRWKNRKTWR